MFLPSQHSDLGAADVNRGKPGASTAGQDIVRGTASALSAGASGVSAGSLLAAGAAASTVPVAGWVVGGALAVGAGTLALVQGIQKRKMSKAQAIRWAKRLKLPDAEEVPGFVLKLSRKDKSWRARVRSRYAKRLSKNRERQGKWSDHPGRQRFLQVITFGVRRGPERLKKQERKLETRIELIDALNEAEKQARTERREEAQEAREAGAAQRSQAAQAPEERENVLMQSFAGAPTWVWLTGIAVLSGAAVVYHNKNKQKAAAK
jgi:hypothetical protein